MKVLQGSGQPSPVPHGGERGSDGFHPANPEGIPDNSPTFQRWVGESRGAQVPKGRLKQVKPPETSAVPLGLMSVATAVPNVETLGYYRMSLRDNGSAPLFFKGRTAEEALPPQP